MTIQTPPLIGIEDNLRLYFKEIEPNPVFIQSLEMRLLKPSTVRIEKAYKRLTAIVVIGAGLSAGVLIYLLFRGLRSLFR